ncbi:hypothetical protein [Ralstonia sp. GX3-BWBA]|uniref:hypothetical protein n=1 Tax=Ralstonia sp. GX3-BWBA TaxID=2219865 RepID=UPI0019551BAC|nr:hypothetical protein [Ralstonia sp. GX3-BWBA]
MPILSKNPRDIHPAYKEAVVDSLLNGLSARLAGRGEFYKVIYGTKPSAALMSEFIVPMPTEERGGDEEADPIRISAHGMDFQIRSAAADTTLSVSLTGAVYVRILPREDDVKPGGRLEPTFPLTKEARAEIRGRIKEALTQLIASLPGGKTNPDWAAKSYDARKCVYESMGLPFDNRLDRSQAEEETEAEGANDENGEEGEARPTQEIAVGLATPDGLADNISPPPKWLRLELSLPSFEFTAATADVDAKKASDALNQTIAKQLADWAANTDPDTGGKLWGYRRARVRPSDVRDWKRYLEAVRASNLAVVIPKIELRWVVQAVPDPVDATRMTVHVALENWTAPLTKVNFKDLEPSLFQVSVAVTVPAADHQFLRLDRVKPSYRYNQYLKYPALGFNGGITLATDGPLHRLTTTWAPRYVLPRIIPTDSAVERNIEKLSQPDCLAGLTPLITTYDAWLAEVEKHPVGQGLEGPNAAEQLTAEREKLHLDLAAWRRELSAIRCGLEILEKSRAHWSGPGMQKSPLGIPFEAWVTT